MDLLKHRCYLQTRDNQKIFYLKNFKNLDEFKGKTPLIFNYGLVCNFQHYKFQIPYFLDLGYPIIMHDYRGHFSSSKIADLSLLNFDNFANDIDDLMQKENIPEAHLIGHSMGVNVTLEFAKKYPEKAKSITLISGTVFPPHEVMFDSNIMEFIIGPAEKFQELFPKFFNLIWQSAGYNPIIQYLILQGGFNPKYVDKKSVETYLIKMGQLNIKIFFHLFNEMKKHDILIHLQKIKTPALIIGGDLDQVVPFKYQNILHNKLQNSKLYLAKDGSHVPIMDFPETINYRIQKFLKGATHFFGVYS